MKNRVNRFSEKFITAFRTLLPSPFTIAIILTVFAFVLALLFGQSENGAGIGITQVAKYWYDGLWNNSLLVFAFQMMFMLVLGHTLALSKPVERAIEFFTENYCSSTSKAAFLVCLLTLCVAYVNWGLGLVFGAIFARKVGELATRKNRVLNYGLIGAAGYSGLMVWHGGLSGSSLVKVAEPGHLVQISNGAVSEQMASTLPDIIAFGDTVFSAMNWFSWAMLLIVVPTAMYFIGKLSPGVALKLDLVKIEQANEEPQFGMEKLDHSRLLGVAIGALILVFSVFLAKSNDNPGAAFITPNWINFSLLGLALLAHGSLYRFLNAINEAISGAAGILVQFPLYFGIMGIMKSSGMIEMFSEILVANSSSTTYPIFTFFSAAVVNVFVPSGGGQWAIQGPIIISSALELGVPLNKGIMAMAYGDQLTNMLQPFWALPLLGITKLKAKQILPYTLIVMVLGALIFLSTLLLF